MNKKYECERTKARLISLWLVRAGCLDATLGKRFYDVLRERRRLSLSSVYLFLINFQSIFLIDFEILTPLRGFNELIWINHFIPEFKQLEMKKSRKIYLKRQNFNISSNPPFKELLISDSFFILILIHISRSLSIFPFPYPYICTIPYHVFIFAFPYHIFHCSCQYFSLSIFLHPFQYVISVFSYFFVLKHTGSPTKYDSWWIVLNVVFQILDKI